MWKRPIVWKNNLTWWVNGTILDLEWRNNKTKRLRNKLIETKDHKLNSWNPITLALGRELLTNISE